MEVAEEIAEVEVEGEVVVEAESRAIPPKKELLLRRPLKTSSFFLVPVLGAISTH